MVPAARPMSRNADPRALRARAALVSAFEAAVLAGQSGEITVSALCRAAGVNRSTFYQHFASPQDIALHSLGELFDLVRDADIVLRSAGSKVSPADASRAAIRGLVEFLAARRTFYAPLLGTDAHPGLRAAVSEAFVQHTVEALRRMDVRPASADPVLVAQFLAGGVLGAIGHWLARHEGPGEPRPGDAADDLVEQLLHCLPAWLMDESPAARRRRTTSTDDRTKD